MKEDMLVKPNKLVHNVVMYKERPWIKRPNVIPFLFVYAIVYMINEILFVNKEKEFDGYLFIMMPIAILAHIISFIGVHWWIDYKCFVNYSKVRSLKEASLLKVINASSHTGKKEIVPLIRNYISEEGREEFIFFYQKCKFIYNEENKLFEKISFPTRLNIGSYKRNKGLLTSDEIKKAIDKYGRNEFDIPMPTFIELYKEQAVAPFFLFQVFCVLLWCLDDYFYFSLMILGMLLMFEATVVQSRLRNLSIFRNMKIPEYDIKVFRKNGWETIKTTELLPGDICIIKREDEEKIAPCDLLLLSGTCITNEAMLTGESTPQLKESILSLNDDDILSIKDKRIHVIFGGTKILQHSKHSGDEKLPKPLNGDGCVAYVLRTGFQTTQGKLVRTILYSSERVTENNKESFAFIGVLLAFALAAAGYVLNEGLKDPEKGKWKLLLECSLIITSVVPSELPMELSLAVNTSLMNLMKENIFCTEPFRIPYAGKVDVCAFDKTGTLTQEHLILKGVLMTKESPYSSSNDDTLLNKTNFDDDLITDKDKLPLESMYVMSGCHSLAYLQSEIIGDPIELAALKFTEWSFSSNDVSRSKTSPYKELKILHRFYFASALRRMTTVVSIDRTKYYGLVKGAPEVIKNFLKDIPSDYELCYKNASRKGYRVIAMAYKEIDEPLSSYDVKNIKRESIESGMTFCGFLIFECPLKDDSYEALKHLRNSSHKIIMITGDNALTACEISSKLDIITNPALILTKIEDENDMRYEWVSVDENVRIPFRENEIEFLSKDYDFCLSGYGLDYFMQLDEPEKYISFIKVFARSSPDQKASIISLFNKAGYTTLMCGDGTNDVGALKKSHVGIALLANPIKKKDDKDQQQQQQQRQQQNKQSSRTSAKRGSSRSRFPNPSDPSEIQKVLQKQLDELANETNPVVQLGDASIASPFTSKSSSVMSILSVLRQGRCTLVTTLQMFKILALNCLIHAYSLSVLYLDGVKYGDFQATITAMLTTACFLFNSRTLPLKKLSKERPTSKLFCSYTVLSVIGQFIVHLLSLIYIVQYASQFDTDHKKEFKLDDKFKPSIINSVVFIVQTAVQLSTFVVNYQGHPFMQSIRENKGLYVCILSIAGIVLTTASQILPDFNEYMELVIFPNELRNMIIVVLIADFILAYLVEIVCKKLLK